ncbi:MAG: YwiC-like family protein, partial [Chloroflexota bacterium]|nr:YwiC-like family protein [Chloroflexota bacterium]
MLGPFIIGTAAGGEPDVASIILLLAVLSLFLIRQPITILVKVLTRRRHRRDAAPAIFWVVVYSVIIGLTTASLIILGFPELMLLAIPAAPVFTWYLYLISKREERGQRGVELVGAGVLAL